MQLRLGRPLTSISSSGRFKTRAQNVCEDLTMQILRIHIWTCGDGPVQPGGPSEVHPSDLFQINQDKAKTICVFFILLLTGNKMVPILRLHSGEGRRKKE